MSPNEILGQKIFLDLNKFLVQKYFWAKERNLVIKKILVKTIFGKKNVWSGKILVQKINSQKYFWSEKMFSPKKNFVQKNFLQKIFLSEIR